MLALSILSHDTCLVLLSRAFIIDFKLLFVCYSMVIEMDCPRDSCYVRSLATSAVCRAQIPFSARYATLVLVSLDIGFRELYFVIAYH